MPGLGGGGMGSGAVRAGRAFVEFMAHDGQLMRSMDRIQKRFHSLASTSVRIGVTAGAVGAAALTPVAAAITGVQDLAKQGDIAKAMGLSAESFTGIAGVAKSAGEDTKEFIESLVTLGKIASEGAAGKGEVAPEFFRQLNIDAKEFAALKPDEQFYRFFEAVQKVGDPLTRVRLLMNAFGEDGGKLLLPLLSKTPEELRKMGTAFAVSADDIQQAKAAQQAYAEATSAVGRAWRAVVVAIAPSIEQVSAAVSRAAGPVTQFIQQNREVVTIALAVAAGLAAAGIAFLGLGLILKGLAVGFGLVAVAAKLVLATIGFLLTPLGAVAAAVVLLVRHWATATESGRAASNQLKAAFQEIGAVFREAFEGITAAVSSGNLELAFKIAGEGIKAVWFKMISAMGKAFAKFVEDNREKIIALGATLGAIKGGRVGGALGPLGMIAGAVGGGILGGFGGDKLADALTGLGHNPAIDAAAVAAEARLKELVADAKRGAGAKGGGKPAETEADRLAKYLPQMRLFDAAKGSFNVPVGVQQFGYGDKVGGVEDRQLKVQKEIEKNTAAAVAALTALPDLFKLS